MIPSAVQWIDKETLREALRNVVKQGFTVMILVAGILWLTDRMIAMEERRDQEYQQLKTEVNQCRDELIEMYRKDRQETLQIIRENTKVMSELKNEISKR